MLPLSCWMNSYLWTLAPSLQSSQVLPLGQWWSWSPQCLATPIHRQWRLSMPSTMMAQMWWGNSTGYRAVQSVSVRVFLRNAPMFPVVFSTFKVSLHRPGLVNCCLRMPLSVKSCMCHFIWSFTNLSSFFFCLHRFTTLFFLMNYLMLRGRQARLNRLLKETAFNDEMFVNTTSLFTRFY